MAPSSLNKKTFFRKTAGGLICQTTTLSKELPNSICSLKEVLGSGKCCVGDDTDLEVSLDLLKGAVLMF